MKKLALTNLALLILVKSVSACDPDVSKGPFVPPVPTEKYIEFFFYGTFILFVPIILFYALSDRLRNWIVITGGLLFLLFYPAVFVSVMTNMCDPDAGADLVKGGFILMTLLLFLQIVAWISPKKSLD